MAKNTTQEKEDATQLNKISICIIIEIEQNKCVKEDTVEWVRTSPSVCTLGLVVGFDNWCSPQYQ